MYKFRDYAKLILISTFKIFYLKKYNVNVINVKPFTPLRLKIFNYYFYFI